MEGKHAPPELQEPGSNYSESPSGAHQETKNKSTDTSFHQAAPAPTAEAASWLLGVGVGLLPKQQLKEEDLRQIPGFCFAS